MTYSRDSSTDQPHEPEDEETDKASSKGRDESAFFAFVDNMYTIIRDGLESALAAMM